MITTVYFISAPNMKMGGLQRKIIIKHSISIKFVPIKIIIWLKSNILNFFWEFPIKNLPKTWLIDISIEH